jgi:hypothetical protein
MIMKNILMVAVVVAGLMTVTYRFLPADMRSKVDAQVNNVAQTKHVLPTANADTEPKKYRLVIPDEQAASQNIQAQAKTSLVASAYIQHLNDIQVQGEGRLIKVLPDDNDGSKHQRFILKTPEEITVLIAHNIDLAQRVTNLTIGDTVYFSGEYVWNEKGGIVHWTHKDPRGRHESGWLKHNGVTYQ